MIGRELRPNGERLVCRRTCNGKLYAVDRPPEWTIEEEGEYVTEMRRSLLAAS
jgi:hypothetical protein